MRHGSFVSVFLLAALGSLQQSQGLTHYASLGEGACAVNGTVVKQCVYYFSFASKESCKQACDDAAATGDESCIGFSATQSEAENRTTCYLYGYSSSCPVVDGVTGSISVFGSQDFTDINSVVVLTGLDTFECNLKLTFVEEHGIAFTSTDR